MAPLRMERQLRSVLASMSSRIKTLFALHMLLMVYSTSGILSKLAAGVDFLSWQFVGLYAGIIALLGIYAIGWQQILRRMALTSAFSNKAVTIVWGIIWGALFFHEPVTVSKVIGAALIIAGVVLFAHADGEEALGSDDGGAGSGPGESAPESARPRTDILGADGVIIDG